MKTKTDVPPPYLCFEEHIKLLQEVEQLFGLCLPASIVARLSFLSNSNFRNFPRCGGFCPDPLEDSKRTLKYTLALPFELYHEWETAAANHFIGAIQLNPQGKFPRGIPLRLSHYTHKIFQFAIMLQLATYPNPMTPFCQLIPSAIEENKFLFNKSTSQYQNRLELIHRDIPSGPARFCQWFFHPDTKQACFHVSLLNSLQNPQTACTFHVPLTIPLAKPWAPVFFMLLSAFIDSFGKECLSEGDEEKIKLLTEEPYLLRDECLRMKGPPEEIFDAFLADSPLLNYLWKNNERNFGSDAHQVKIDLYLFIKTFRFYFKKGFFLALNDQEIESSMSHAQNKEHFQVFQFDNKANESCLFYHVFEHKHKEKDIYFTFEQVYHETEELRSLPSNHAFVFHLEIGHSLLEKTLRASD